MEIEEETKISPDILYGCENLISTAGNKEPENHVSLGQQCKLYHSTLSLCSVVNPCSALCLVMYRPYVERGGAGVTLL